MSLEWTNANIFKNGVLSFINRHFREIKMSYPISKFRFNHYQSCLLLFYENCDATHKMNDEDYKKFKELYEEYRNIWEDARDKAKNFFYKI